MKATSLKLLRTSGDFVTRVWRHGLKPGSPAAFVFALACVVAATLTRHLLGLIDPAIIVFSPYFPAVLAATLIGGLPSGILALVLGALSAWWSFLPPTHAFFPITRDQAVSLIVFCAAGAIIVIAAEGHRRLLRRYYERENFNQLLIAELQHRLRNKVATVQAMLSRDLRNDNGLPSLIAGRLAAIARTDELMLKSDDECADIAGIVRNELGPYGVPSRVRVKGEPVVLPPMLALSLTLIVHELSTNAAKYGALSTSQAQIDVSWWVDDDRVKMVWIESGGPRVQGPDHEGFGSELFRQALVPFDGSVEQEFAPDGLKCKIAFVLPRARRLRSGFKSSAAA